VILLTRAIEWRNPPKKRHANETIFQAWRARGSGLAKAFMKALTAVRAFRQPFLRLNLFRYEKLAYGAVPLHAA
jgi:hypothetical protein